MTDDEILVLWTLDGSWGWEQLQEYFKKRDTYWTYQHENFYELLISLKFGYFELNNIMYFFEWNGHYGPNVTQLYVIEDAITFLPNEMWKKLLLAKTWYKKHQTQFE